MREHEPVYVVLASLRPLAVMLPDHRRAVSQDIGDLFECGALFKQPGCQRVPKPVRVRVLHTGFPENRSKGPFRYPDHRSPRRYAIPEIVAAILGGVAGQRQRLQAPASGHPGWGGILAPRSSGFVNAPARCCHRRARRPRPWQRWPHRRSARRCDAVATPSPAPGVARSRHRRRGASRSLAGLLRIHLCRTQ